MGIMTDIRFKLHQRRTLLAAAIVVAVSSLLVSCGKHDDKPKGSVISLDVVHKSSRALVNGVAGMGAQSVSNGTGFGVYGYKTVGKETATPKESLVFDNVDVYASELSSEYKWEYSPLKYWDVEAYYHFVAYWPYKTEGVTHTVSGENESTRTLTLSVPNWQWESVRSYDSGTDTFTTSDNQSCMDLLYSYSQDEGQNYVTHTNGYVNFTFSHALAWLEVQVASPSLATNPTTDYFVTGLSIGNDPAFTTHDNCNVPDGTGSFAFNMTYSGTSPLSSYGTPGGTAGYAGLYPASSGQQLKLTAEDQLLCSSLCVPFSVTGEGIFLNVTYNSGSGTPETMRSVAIPLPDSGNLLELEGGKKYVVKLRFDMGEPLKVVKVYISDWIAGGTSDHQFYNW